VIQVDTRLGYAHRGILRLMREKTPAEAAGLAARLSASTVANGLAFARAVEAATGIEPPPRAIAIRLVLLDLERVALGLHDLAETLDASGRDPARVRRTREDLLRACEAAFGHRLLMDLVVPGGIARDLSPEAARAVAAPLERLKLPGVAGFDSLRASVATLLTRPRTLPEGALSAAVPITIGEGLGQSEGGRGTHFHWVQVRDGRILQAFARDPAWLAWPRFQSAMEGRMLADLPVLAAGLSVAGVDG
jgi:Ni,Fe-hydrogenase III large subunit